MSVGKNEQEVVERMFKAMQAGPDGEEPMVELFTDDAVLVEPFSGQTLTHRGKDAIRESFRGMWADPAPDMELKMDRVDRDGDRVRADWTCTSPVFPAPMRGYDLFTIRDGRIARLEIVLTDAPPMGERQ